MKATTEFDEITVFGARGHTLVILRGMEEFWRGRVRLRALVDDIENGFVHPVLGIPVISSEERLRQFAEVPILLTPGSGSLRARMAKRFTDEGATLATASCPGQLHVDPVVDYGAGCLCMSFSRIGPNVRIGAGVQLLASVLAHDVTIGDFATVGSGVCVSGHVEIGEGAHIGPQAVITNGSRDRPLRIGAGAIVGVGAAVLRDVPAGARVIGNPAMPVRDWVRLQRLLKQP
ncbi:acetyltransferase [Gemmobacter fulvus]|uniref:Acetyltransferase n=1 Tax=Gemmobacter fulvus TaxID=2840474 RepID=A0A975P3S6_9RHOB|nr:acetyltransferase [Gemmobacter fulvus]MBT9245879.1 acetyltransferase [Gemmobacter fulvus]MDQ1846907.1 acetyltransferase [Gemmobacter fulvus]QWK89289.1 acetyltransferase [Gemmobacter fulvus]